MANTSVRIRTETYVPITPKLADDITKIIDKDFCSEVAARIVQEILNNLNDIYLVGSLYTDMSLYVSNGDQFIPRGTDFKIIVEKTVDNGIAYFAIRASTDLRKHINVFNSSLSQGQLRLNCETLRACFGEEIKKVVIKLIKEKKWMFLRSASGYMNELIRIADYKVKSVTATATLSSITIKTDKLQYTTSAVKINRILDNLSMLFGKEAMEPYIKKIYEKADVEYSFIDIISSNKIEILCYDKKGAKKNTRGFFKLYGADFMTKFGELYMKNPEYFSITDSNILKIFKVRDLLTHKIERIKPYSTNEYDEPRDIRINTGRTYSICLTHSEWEEVKARYMELEPEYGPGEILKIEIDLGVF